MKTLITNKQLHQRISEVSNHINELVSSNPYYADAVCIPILQGSIPFFTDISKHFCWNPVVDYVGLSSYDGETQVQFHPYKMPKRSLVVDKVVFLFDDILDTGKTANFFTNTLYSLGAREVIPVFLLKRKNTNWAADSRIRSVIHCFDIADEWVFGYGMDDVESRYRTAKHILYNEQTTKTAV